MSLPKNRCPCGSYRVEQTTMGGPILPRTDSLDLTNRGTCEKCGYQAPVALFQLYAIATDQQWRLDAIRQALASKVDT